MYTTDYIQLDSLWHWVALGWNFIALAVTGILIFTALFCTILWSMKKMVKTTKKLFFTEENYPQLKENNSL